MSDSGQRRASSSAPSHFVEMGPTTVAQHNAVRPRAALESFYRSSYAPSFLRRTRPYVGLEKLNQTLRWVSTAAMTGGNKREVQATVFDGSLIMSANREAGDIGQHLHAALTRAEPFAERRTARHVRRLKRHLIDESGFEKFRSKMMEEIKARKGARPLGLSWEDAEKQAPFVLEAVRKAVVGVHGKSDSTDLRVIPSQEEGTATMHAEQSIYTAIGTRREEIQKATLAARGYRDTVAPLLLPVAGTKRPCNVCHEVENEATQEGLFTRDFALLRTSRTPGIAYDKRQYIATPAFDRPSEQAQAVVSRFHGGDPTKQRTAAQRFYRIDQAADTDSEDEDETPPRRAPQWQAKL